MPFLTMPTQFNTVNSVTMMHSVIAAQLLECRSGSRERLEFELETTGGRMLLQAPSREWYLLWTDGMDSVMRYSKTLIDLDTDDY